MYESVYQHEKQCWNDWKIISDSQATTALNLYLFNLVLDVLTEKVQYDIWSGKFALKWW